MSVSYVEAFVNYTPCPDCGPPGSKRYCAQHEPPPDHEDFEALRNYGFRRRRELMEKRRRKPTGA